jgi:hypothetical protein
MNNIINLSPRGIEGSVLTDPRAICPICRVKMRLEVTVPMEHRSDRAPVTKWLFRCVDCKEDAEITTTP